MHLEEEVGWVWELEGLTVAATPASTVEPISGNAVAIAARRLLPGLESGWVSRVLGCKQPTRLPELGAEKLHECDCMAVPNRHTVFPPKQSGPTLATSAKDITCRKLCHKERVRRGAGLMPGPPLLAYLELFNSCLELRTRSLLVLHRSCRLRPHP